jgi:hypothetical protein
MLSTIEWLKDSRLLAPYESWRETNDLGEKTMMENIQHYCRGKTYKSVFLVGAAHRQPIIDIAREQSAVDQPGYSGILVTG